MEVYEYVKSISRGSFGYIDLYRRKIDGKNVIIKKVALTCMTKEEQKNAFNEATIMTKLKHSNIINLYGWFAAYSTLCIVMEYAARGTLQDFMEKRNGLLLSQINTIYIFSQLVVGLHYIHEQGILHRDLKPTNVLLQSKGREILIKIADFSISKVLESLTESNFIMGTLRYMAPELIEGEVFDKRSDIWSLGCILYELLTLKKIFDGKTIGSTISRVLKCQIFPSPDPIKYDKYLRLLLKKLLCVELNQRPTTQQITNNFCNIRY